MLRVLQEWERWSVRVACSHQVSVPKVLWLKRHDQKRAKAYAADLAYAPVFCILMFDGMFLITSLAIYISGEPVQPKTEEKTKAEDTTAVSPD